MAEIINFNKIDLEIILDSLVSAKSKETFLMEYCSNAGLDTIKTRVNNIPEQFIDALLEIKHPDEHSHDNQKHLMFTYALALAAEKTGRHGKAAHLYKKLDDIHTAVAQARLAGLDELANKWADEYIKGSFQENPIGYFSTKELVEAAIERAHNVGMIDKAKDIARKYIGNLDAYLREKPDDPDLLEETADFAKKHKLAEEADLFYRTAMQQFEEAGKYDDALRIAKKLKDSEKIKFYDTVRYIVADSKTKALIEEQRAEERDALK